MCSGVAHNLLAVKRSPMTICFQLCLVYVNCSDEKYGNHNLLVYFGCSAMSYAHADCTGAVLSGLSVMLVYFWLPRMVHWCMCPCTGAKIHQFTLGPDITAPVCAHGTLHSNQNTPQCRLHSPQCSDVWSSECNSGVF